MIIICLNAHHTTHTWWWRPVEKTIIKAAWQGRRPCQAAGLIKQALSRMKFQGFLRSFRAVNAEKEYFTMVYITCLNYIHGRQEYRPFVHKSGSSSSVKRKTKNILTYITYSSKGWANGNLFRLGILTGQLGKKMLRTETSTCRRAGWAKSG